MTDDQPFDDYDDHPEGPSKSQRKRDSEALQELGAALVRLSPERLAGVPLPEDLRGAIDTARKIHAHGALRRQLQYIGKLMRGVDADPIRAALDRIEQQDEQAKGRLHRIERWRERMLLEGDAALADFLSNYPAADRQQLRQLMRGAQAEQAAGKPPRLTRELFRCLRELVEAGES